MKAADILRAAAETVESHQSGRDANNESSIALAARMFSEWRGIEFSERDAAVFMVLLKLARAERSHNPDNWLDGAAYVAMAGASDVQGSGSGDSGLGLDEAADSSRHVRSDG